MHTKQVSTISERRSKYPLHERLIVYNSESMQRMIDNKSSTPVSLTNPATSNFMVNGVNILNKNSLDSDTVMNRIIQRRKTHNRVERRRRDRMNSLFSDLSKCLPTLQHKTYSNRADVLQEAIDYIKHIKNENYYLKHGSFPQMPNLYEDDAASITSSSSSEIDMVFPIDSNLLIKQPDKLATSSTSACSFVPEANQSEQLTTKNKRKKPIMTPPQSQFEFVLSFQ
ncbi:hypothetical protein INT46_001176 [Mucor plumbeus]|uniref:BHLH domain-containing protein n=1 Tax=Mucor plumbeus TaxID=97098 RepID=A0A8H7USK5_9FUNG|nr:hypothetical protein INT46_001176 [Mucor plumbeus]